MNLMAISNSKKSKKKDKKDKEDNRIYAFIDSQNLNLGVKANGWTLDFGKFRLYLRNKYNVKKAFLFIGYIVGNARLYQYLQECGYILVFKNVLEIKRGGKSYYKGNVDAGLVLHAMIEYKNYGKAIIVSGDGDFRCLVEYLGNKGKLEKVIVPNKHYSSLLRKYSKYIFTLGLAKNKLEKKEK